jgi:RNA polymerase primary sigma factor
VSEDWVFGEFVADHRAVSPDARLVREDARRYVRKAPESLRKSERRVLEFRYGIVNEREHSLQEIADRVGLSRERVRQIELQPMNRLQRRRLRQRGRAAA